jgi:DNA-binding transcriptional LysR family regulator
LTGGASASVSSWPSQLAARLQHTAPGIELRVCALPDDWIPMFMFLRGDIDLKLDRKYALPDSLASQDLADDQFVCVQFVCVVRREHPAPSTRPRALGP